MVLLLDAECVDIRFLKHFAKLGVAVVQNLELLLDGALLGLFGHLGLIFIGLDFEGAFLGIFVVGPFGLFISSLSFFYFVFGSVEDVRAFFEIILP